MFGLLITTNEAKYISFSRDISYSIQHSSYHHRSNAPMNIIVSLRKPRIRIQ